MSSVDNRIVQMKFDNAQFESGVAATTKTLEQFEQQVKGIDGLNVDGINKMVPAIETVANRFTFMGDLAYRAFGRIKESFLDMIGTMNNNVGFIVNPMSGMTDGFSEYEALIDNTKAITVGARMSQEAVEAMLDRMNAYADQTIYNFGQMVDSTKMFINAGVEASVAETAIIGIANASAYAGLEASKANIAMYNFSQAMANGFLGQSDYRSINQAGFMTMVLKEQLVDAAEAAGTLVKQYDEATGEFVYMTTTTNNMGKTFTGTMEQLFMGMQYQWLNKEVMLDVLQEYGDKTTEVGKAAFESATQLRTFSMFIDSTREALGSGWATTWKIVVGGLQESTAMWTAVGNSIGEFATQAAAARNNFLMEWSNDGGRTAVIEGLAKAYETLSKVLGTIKEAFRAVFPPMLGTDLANISRGFADFMKSVAPTDDTLRSLRDIFRGLFSAIDILLYPVGLLFDGFKSLFGIFSDDSNGKSFLQLFLDIAAAIGNMITYIDQAIHSFTSFADFGNKLKVIFMDAFNKISESLAAIFDKINFEGLFSNDLVQGIYNGFMNGIDYVVQAVVSFAQSIYDAFCNFFGIHSPSTVMADIGYYVIMGLVKGIQGAASILIGAFEGILNVIMATIAVIFGVDSPIFKMADQIYLALTDLTEDISVAIKGIGNAISDGFQALFGGGTFNTSIKDFGKQLIQLLLVGFFGALGLLNKAVQNVGDFIMAGLSKSFGDTIMVDLIKGLIIGIQQGVGAVVAAVAVFVNTLIFTFMDMLGIHSPSTVMAEIGYFLVAGLVNGISSAANLILGALQVLVVAIGVMANALLGWIPGATDIVNKFAWGVYSGLEFLGMTIYYMAEEIKSTFRKLLGINSPSSVFYEYGVNIWQGLLNGLKSVGNALVAVMGTMGTMVINGFGKTWSVITSLFGKIFAASPSYAAEGTSELTKSLDEVNGVVVSKTETIADKLYSIYASASAKIKNVLITLGDYMWTVWDWLTTIFGPMIEWIVNFLKDLNLDKITNLFWSLSAFLTAGAFNNFSNSFAGVMDTLGGVVDGFSGIMDKIATALGNFGKKSRGDVLMTIAEALIYLAGAIVVLSILPWSLVEQGLIVMASLMGMLSILSLALGRITASFKAATLLALSGALVTIAIAMSILGNLSFADVFAAWFGLAVAIRMMAKAITKLNTADFDNATKGLGKLAKSLITMAIVIKIFSMFDLTTMLSGFLAIASTLATIAISLRAFSEFQKFGIPATTIPQLNALAAALMMLTIPIFILSLMSSETFVGGLLRIAQVLVVLAIALRAFGEFAKYGIPPTVIPQLTGIASSLMGLTVPIAILGLMPLGVVAQGIMAVGAALAVIGIALKAWVAWGPKIGASVVPSLAGLAVSIAALAIPIAILGLMEFETIIAGLVGVGGAVAALAGASWALSKLGDMTVTAKQLVVLAGAVGILAASLYILSGTDPVGLGIAFLALASVIGVLVGAMKVYSKFASNLTGSVVQLLGMATAIGVLAGSLYLLASLNPENLAMAFIALTTTIAMFLVALKSFPSISATWQQILAIGALALSLSAIAVPLYLLSKINFTDILGALGSIGLAIAGMTAIAFGASFIAEPLVIGAGAIITLAAALAAFALACYAGAKAWDSVRVAFGGKSRLSADIKEEAKEVEKSGLPESIAKVKDQTNKQISEIATPADAISGNVQEQMDEAVKALQTGKADVEKEVADTDNIMGQMAVRMGGTQSAEFKKYIRDLEESGTMTAEEIKKNVDKINRTMPEISNTAMPEQMKAMFDDTTQAVQTGSNDVMAELDKYGIKLSEKDRQAMLFGVEPKELEKARKKEAKETEKAAKEQEKIRKASLTTQQKDRNTAHATELKEETTHKDKLKAIFEEWRNIKRSDFENDEAYRKKLLGLSQQAREEEKLAVEEEKKNVKIRKQNQISALIEQGKLVEAMNVTNSAIMGANTTLNVNSLPDELRQLFSSSAAVVKVNGKAVTNELFNFSRQVNSQGDINLQNIPLAIKQALALAVREAYTGSGVIKSVMFEEGKEVVPQIANGIAAGATENGAKTTEAIATVGRIIGEKGGKLITEPIGQMGADGAIKLSTEFLKKMQGEGLDKMTDAIGMPIEVVTKKGNDMVTAWGVIGENMMGKFVTESEHAFVTLDDVMAQANDKMVKNIFDKATQVSNVVDSIDTMTKQRIEFMKSEIAKLEMILNSTSDTVADPEAIKAKIATLQAAIDKMLPTEEVKKDAAEVKEAAGGALDGVAETIAQKKEAISESFLGAFSNLDQLTAKKTQVEKTFSDTMDSILKKFKEGFSTEKLKPIGQAIPDGIWEGIKSKTAQFLGKIGELCQQAIARARKELDINSPSKVFEGIGGSVGEGLVNGINDSNDSVSNASANLAQAAIDPIKGALDQIVDSELSGYSPVIEPVLDTDGFYSESDRFLDSLIEKDNWNTRKANLDAAKANKQAELDAAYQQFKLDKDRAKYEQEFNRINEKYTKLTDQWKKEIPKGAHGTFDMTYWSFPDSTKKQSDIINTNLGPSKPTNSSMSGNFASGNGGSSGGGPSPMTMINNITVNDNNMARTISNKIATQVSRSQYAKGRVNYA